VTQHGIAMTCTTDETLSRSCSGGSRNFLWWELENTVYVLTKKLYYELFQNTQLYIATKNIKIHEKLIIKIVFNEVSYSKNI
jgi:hypothetical protein